MDENSCSRWLRGETKWAWCFWEQKERMHNHTDEWRQACNGGDRIQNQWGHEEWWSCLLSSVTNRIDLVRCKRCFLFTGKYVYWCLRSCKIQTDGGKKKEQYACGPHPLPHWSGGAKEGGFREDLGQRSLRGIVFRSSLCVSVHVYVFLFYRVLLRNRFPE